MSFNYKNLVTLCSSWYLILKLYYAISKDKDDTHSVNTMLKLHTHRDDYYFLINHRDDCRLLSTRFRLIRFNHCYPEANRCEDGMARKGAAQSDDFILFNSPPVDLETSFNFDLNGLYSMRRCSVSLIS